MINPKNLSIKNKLVRINSRIRKEQLDYIKKYADDFGLTEGETHRLIIDEFIISKNHM
jgi:hypothetical protein